MAVPLTSPVIDSVPKIKDEVAVGEDIDFQRRWWIFERVAWAVFALILIMTILGCFGRGPLAKAEARSPDQLIFAKYDRIQRAGTPSDITVVLGDAAVHEGQVKLFVGESLISKLGAQRISPQPDKTYLDENGLTYLFPVLHLPATVIFSVEPSGPGKFPLMITLPEKQSSIQKTIYVVP